MLCTGWITLVQLFHLSIRYPHTVSGISAGQCDAACPIRPLCTVPSYAVLWHQCPGCQQWQRKGVINDLFWLALTRVINRFTQRAAASATCCTVLQGPSQSTSWLALERELFRGDRVWFRPRCPKKPPLKDKELKWLNPADYKKYCKNKKAL